MGGSEVAFALAIGAATAASSAKSAQQQNKALSRSAGSAERSNRIQNEQIRESAKLEARKIQARAAQVRGLIRVSGTGRGIGSAGSVESQLFQADLDEQISIDAINLNNASASEFARSRLEAIGIDINSRRLNPILSGFMGGLQGFSTGLSIADTAQQIGRVNTAGTQLNGGAFNVPNNASIV